MSLLVFTPSLDSVLGLEAFMINGGVMVALGIASWFPLPDKPP